MSNPLEDARAYLALTGAESWRDLARRDLCEAIHEASEMTYCSSWDEAWIKGTLRRAVDGASDQLHPHGERGWPINLKRLRELRALAGEDWWPTYEDWSGS